MAELDEGKKILISELFRQSFSLFKRCIIRDVSIEAPLSSADSQAR